MKYFIGYLIRGEAAKWHIETAKQISEKFNTWKIHEKIPPHITIFYLDELEDIHPLRDFLKNWVNKSNISGSFHIDGFDHFDDRVVFAKAKIDDNLVPVITELKKNIKEVSHATKEEAFKPHATLANRVSSEDIQNIWNYVMTLEAPNFSIPFDNVTIFEYAGDREWKVLESFDLSPAN